MNARSIPYHLLSLVATCYSTYFVAHFFTMYFTSPVAWMIAIGITIPLHAVTMHTAQDLIARKITASAPLLVLLATVATYADWTGIQQERGSRETEAKGVHAAELRVWARQLGQARQRAEELSSWADGRKDWGRREVWLRAEEKAAQLQAEGNAIRQRHAQEMAEVRQQAAGQTEQLRGGVIVSIALSLLSAIALAQAARQTRTEGQQPYHHHECEQCGGPSSGRKFCSQSCKQTAYRRRKKLEAA